MEVEPTGVESWLDIRVHARRKLMDSTVITNVDENKWQYNYQIEDKRKVNIELNCWYAEFEMFGDIVAFQNTLLYLKVVKFPRYFIHFEAIVNGIVFLISLLIVHYWHIKMQLILDINFVSLLLHWIHLSILIVSEWNL